MISNRFWQRRLEGDPNAIGRTLSLNNTLFTVIGVLPANYRSVQGLGVHPEVFIPFNTALQPNLFDPKANVMIPVGRLNPGRTREQTQQLLQQTLTPVSGLPRTGGMTQARPILAFSGRPRGCGHFGAFDCLRQCGWVDARARDRPPP